MSVFNRRLFLVLTVGSHVNGPSTGSPRTHLLLQPMQKQEPEVKRPRSKSFPAWEEPGSEGSSQSTLSYEETPKEPSVEVCSGGGYYHIWAIHVCAALKGMVLKQFTLG